jgi:hypothetical protein
VKAVLKPSGEIVDTKIDIVDSALSSEPQTWFFTSMDCDFETNPKKKTMPIIKFNLEVTQPDGSHFSFDSEDMLNLHIFLLCVTLVLMVFNIKGFKAFSDKHDSVASPYMILTISLGLQIT